MSLRFTFHEIWKFNRYRSSLFYFSVLYAVQQVLYVLDGKPGHRCTCYMHANVCRSGQNEQVWGRENGRRVEECGRECVEQES